jgi:C-terminal processing protease CtpA/Prc
VYNIATKKSVSLNAATDNYSAQDGDLAFAWSPQSKYLTLQAGNNLVARLDIDLVKADGSGKPINLTKGAYASLNPRWSADGKMIYYQSGKEGSGGQRDAFGLFLDRSAFLHFGKPLPKIKSDSASNYSPELKMLEDRELKLTGVTAPLSDAVLSPDGHKLYSLSAFGNIQGIYVTDEQSHDEILLTKLPQAAGKLNITVDGKYLYLLSGGKLSKISTADGSLTAVTVSGSQQLNLAEQRAYILEHLYHLFGRKFYDPKLGGVDWTYYYNQYKRFLEHINNNYDFEVLLSELIGELNSSHSGAGYRLHLQGGDETASLGLLYDLSTIGNGLRVKEILAGGPFDLTETRLKPGDIIDRIDGNAITESRDWAQFLNRKSGKQITVSYHQPEDGKEFMDIIMPVLLGEETDLLYKRWVHLMEHMTDSLSKGQVAYVHIREMSKECLRATYEGAAGRGLGKKAVILDTRYNTGGNIHEDLMAMITGSDALLYNRPQSANQVDEGNSGALNKPTCVIVSEGNYSDGFNFPYLYQLRKSGKLIGMPVAGTGTGPWYETQVDPTLFAGIPEIGLSLPGDAQPLLENHRLDPDILVRDDYKELLGGRDRQLEEAVKELLKEIKDKT